MTTKRPACWSREWTVLGTPQAPQVAAAVLVAAGCRGGTVDGRADAGAGPDAAVLGAGPPSVEELAAATYRGLDGIGGQVTLAGGRWEGEPYGEGAAARPSVALVDMPPVVGDLDGDGEAEAVVFLASSTGGSGERLYLAVVHREQAGLVNTATALVGDRVRLRDARCDGDLVVLDLVQAGAEDAMCCPGDLATRAWRLEGGGLPEVSAEVTGRLSPEVMAGPEWVLERWNVDDEAPAEPEVTLTFAEGVLAGSSGCNRYTANVTAGDGPGEITIGPVAGTRMVCPPGQMAVEDRYLAALAGVSRFGFWNGRLALTAKTDEGVATLLFAVRQTVADGGGGE